MTPQQDVRIFDFIIRTAWLHFEDALAIDKIKLFAGTYRQGQGKADTTAFHYLDVPMLRPYLADLSWGKPIEFMDFKGSPPKGDEPCESRILRVNSDDDGNVWWTLVHGPGKLTKTGAIQPAYAKGQYDKIIRVKMTRDEARMMACQVSEYLQAYTTAQILQRQLPQQRPAVSVETANEDWFKIPQVQQANGNGHSNGATAVREKIAPAVAYKKKIFFDGQPCPPDYRSHYEAFWLEKRTVPNHKRHLIDWIYR